MKTPSTQTSILFTALVNTGSKNVANHKINMERVELKHTV